MSVCTHTWGSCQQKQNKPHKCEVEINLSGKGKDHGWVRNHLCACTATASL